MSCPFFVVVVVPQAVGLYTMIGSLTLFYMMWTVVVYRRACDELHVLFRKTVADHVVAMLNADQRYSWGCRLGRSLDSGQVLKSGFWDNTHHVLGKDLFFASEGTKQRVVFSHVTVLKQQLLQWLRPYRPVFRGFFFVLPMRGLVAERVVCMHSRMNSVGHAFRHVMQGLTQHTYELESSTFGDRFCVYAQSDADAFQAFPPHVQEVMTQVADALDGVILLIDPGCSYLLVDNIAMSLDISLWTAVDDGAYRAVVEQLGLLQRVVQSLLVRKLLV